MDIAVSQRRRERLLLGMLLLGTAGLNLWGLGASGWANSFYSAAVQAGSQSWSAFFFGASDAAGSITVDKPPLALWPMVASVRLFGLSSWSILVPQAIMGVASVALLVSIVRRTTGSAAAGLLAGAALALTPVAVLMFRFNNPDALLTLLLLGSAACTLRAVDASWDSPRARRTVGWLVLGGSLVGLAFLTKMLQSFLVLPPLALAFFCFAAGPVWRRLAHLLTAFAAMIAAGSWWVVAVALWPPEHRPYIGGSQNNSILELVIGYNGLGRLSGNEVGSVSGGNGWGATGPLRLFGSANGGGIAWLLPAALILGVTAWLLLRRRPAADTRRLRAGLTLWLSWVAVTGLTFSMMAGIYHPYYTVALAPAIAACVGIGGYVCWQHHREERVARALAVTALLTGAVAFIVLTRVDDWLPWLRWVVALVALLAAASFARPRLTARIPQGVLAATCLVAAFLGPTAFSLATAAAPHGGAIPEVGPPEQVLAYDAAAEDLPTWIVPGDVEVPAAGSLLESSTPGPDVVAALLENASSYTWVAAVTGANSAAGFQLATERPVMPVGGFNGTDPAPTLATFKRLVREGRIHFYIADGAHAGTHAPGREVVRTGSNAALHIERWVERRFPPQVIDEVTLYDLTPAAQPGDGASTAPSR